MSKRGFVPLQKNLPLIKGKGIGLLRLEETGMEIALYIIIFALLVVILVLVLRQRKV